MRCHLSPLPPSPWNKEEKQDKKKIKTISLLKNHRCISWFSTFVALLLSPCLCPKIQSCQIQPRDKRAVELTCHKQLFRRRRPMRIVHCVANIQTVFSLYFRPKKYHTFTNKQIRKVLAEKHLKTRFLSAFFQYSFLRQEHRLFCVWHTGNKKNKSAKLRQRCQWEKKFFLGKFETYISVL